MKTCSLKLISFLLLATFVRAEPLAGTKSLEIEGDLSARMVAGIDGFLLKELEQSIEGRAQFWNRDFSSEEQYNKSIQPNRERFRKIIGAVDPLAKAEVITLNTLSKAEDPVTIRHIRWRVFEQVWGEGLLFEPKGKVAANVISLPDPARPPNQDLLAYRLAVAGCRVVVPVLINRSDEWSGSEHTKIFTNQPHREWIYRQAFEMGRHIIGYEVRKCEALIEWFAEDDLPTGIAGYGEGALIAFYTAALDTRVQATFISGYFESREAVWKEPIYRNLFGLLREFGDAEIASMIAPRRLFIGPNQTVRVSGPPSVRAGRRGGAAPGRIAVPSSEEAEKTRLLKLFEGQNQAWFTAWPENPKIQLEHEHPAAFGGFASKLVGDLLVGNAEKMPEVSFPAIQKEQVQQLVNHTQDLLRHSEYRRAERYWKTIQSKNPEAWSKERLAWQKTFYDDVIGRLRAPDVPLNPRSRTLKETENWTAYEVVLDVWEGVYAWGYLLVPKNLKPGEKRPVVVCQHGLEGLPDDTINSDPTTRSWKYYKGFAAQLADRGFVTFAPHNPYRGGDRFRVLQRKLNPLGLTLFSVITPQHERILDFLSSQPFVDSERIGFYGLSYGGKTAMRVPALVDRYALSICSADFNEWVKKNATVDASYSYIFTGEYEIFEFDLGHTFNYAEMAALIAPRPFMVERGHHDGVAPDEWVAYEYAKVRRFYQKIGIPERTEIEFFDGPHTINGKGTFEFLHKHLNWPR